jgi:hypothetical protein|tara:strand:- start:865 stop:1086 length:222 start_codon:yes stop_codon:yes gene_type:complete
MDLKKHKDEFDKIISKYNLSDHDKAEEISTFLTNSKRESVSPKEFAELFGMTVKEATIFLSFIEKGIQFKENR